MVKHSIVSLPQSLIIEHVYLTFAVIQPANIYDFKGIIPELRGDNYKVWKERVLLHLGWMDIDYAIRKEELDPNTKTSTAEAVCLYDKWEKSNSLSMMFIKTKISAGIRGPPSSPEQEECVIISCA